MITAGALRHRITIEKVTETRDTFGGATETWSAFATMWAAVEPIRGREFFAADVVNSEVTHRVRIRHRAGITPKMRVAFGDRIFDIQAVLNIEERNREVHLMCKELVSSA